jgi:hypothetical protein
LVLGANSGAQAGITLAGLKLATAGLAIVTLSFVGSVLVAVSGGVDLRCRTMLGTFADTRSILLIFFGAGGVVSRFSSRDTRFAAVDGRSTISGTAVSPSAVPVDITTHETKATDTSASFARCVAARVNSIEAACLAMGTSLAGKEEEKSIRPSCLRHDW